MPTIRSFVAAQKSRRWDLLQLDPQGPKSKADLLGQFHGKPIFRPQPADQLNKCRSYQGFHAVVIRKSAAPRLSQWFMEQTPMEMAKVPEHLPNTLSYGALVAKEPKAVGKNQPVELPSFCSDLLLKTVEEADASRRTAEDRVRAKFVEESGVNEHSLRHYAAMVELGEELTGAVGEKLTELQTSFKESREQLSQAETQVADLRAAVAKAEKELAVMMEMAEDSEQSAPKDLVDATQDPMLEEAQKKVSDLKLSLEAAQKKHDVVQGQVGKLLEKIYNEQVTMGAVKSFGSTLDGGLDAADEGSSIIQLGEEEYRPEGAQADEKSLEHEMSNLHRQMSKLDRRGQVAHKEAKQQTWQTRLAHQMQQRHFSARQFGFDRSKIERMQKQTGIKMIVDGNPGDL